jgi:uncharacterized protein YbjT (DUF2867 family)
MAVNDERDRRRGRTAWVAGGSGLVGRALLEQLAQDPRWSRVVALGRRPQEPLPGGGSKIESRVVDFAALVAAHRVGGGEVGPGAGQAGDERVDDVFCALGASLGAGWSNREVQRVDHDYVLAVARASLEAGARQFLVVTSMGAEPAAPLAYCRTKAAVETALAALPFASVQVLRPSFLRGERLERRRWEELAIVVADALGRLVPAAYRPVDAATVAAAMVALAAREEVGRFVHPSDRFAEIAREAR